MQTSTKIALGVVVFVAISAHAAITATTRIEPAENAVSPFAHIRFCMQYPNDCKRSGSAKFVAFTTERRAELDEVNARVNAQIVPQRVPDTVTNEKWVIGPREGDCNDYAVTKRHELLQKGWASAALLLAVVQLSDGEHHLVLIARTDRDDFVLDNLKPEVRPLQEVKEYNWEKVQSADNPEFWKAAKVEGS